MGKCTDMSAFRDKADIVIALRNVR